MPKRAAKEKEPTFEQALAELEKLVEEMEKDQLPLEALVEHYENGSRLLARCEAVLKSARQRIEMITLDAPPADPEQGGVDELDLEEGEAPAPGDDDEIRLL